MVGFAFGTGDTEGAENTLTSQLSRWQIDAFYANVNSEVF